MTKGLTIAAMAAAALMLLLFAMDLAVKIPFRRASPIMDIAFVLASSGLGYVAWNAFRDVR